MVSWEKICRPKSEGGLGFHNLKILNQAHMMKLAWSLLVEKDKLWVKILQAKYACRPTLVPTIALCINSSPLWRSIVQQWARIIANTIWVVRDGKGVRFWRDAWIPGCGTLFECADARRPLGEDEFSISHYAQDGQWKWEVL